MVTIMTEILDSSLTTMNSASIGKCDEGLTEIWGCHTDE